MAIEFSAVLSGASFGNFSGSFCSCSVAAWRSLRAVFLQIGDIGKAKRIALDVMRAQPQVLADPAPIAEVLSLGDSAVNLTLRSWARPSDNAAVLFAVNHAVKEAFDQNGIEMPFPQLEVRMKS